MLFIDELLLLLVSFLLFVEFIATAAAVLVLSVSVRDRLVGDVDDMDIDCTADIICRYILLHPRLFVG